MKRVLPILIAVGITASAWAQTNVLATEGNSMMNYPDLAHAWPTKLVLPANCGKTNVAQSGQDINQRLADINTAVISNLDLTCLHQVLSLLEGGNSIAHGSNALAAYAGLTNEIVLTQKQRPGVLTALGTVWYRGDFDATQDGYRIDLDNMIRTNYGGLTNVFVIDYASNSNLDARFHPENFLNDTFFHPNDSGTTEITNQNMVPLSNLLLYGSTNSVPPVTMNAGAFNVGILTIK